MRVDAADVSEIALDLSGNSRSRAKAHDVSKRTERRCGSGHSAATMLAQELLLISTQKELELDPPTWSTCTPLWDETGEKLKVFLSRTKRMITATMQMFVFIVAFSWGWADGRMQTLRAVCPPLPITTTSAESLWDAMRTHPWTRPLWKFREFLVKITKELAMQFSTTDQASGNRRVVCYELFSRARVLLATLPCFNHQTFLGHLDMVIAVWTGAFLCRLYNVAKFFNMGAHRLRCAMVVPRYVRDATVFGEGFPQESDIAYGQELVSYVEAWEKQNLDGKQLPKHAAPKQSTLLKKFFSIVSGPCCNNSTSLIVLAKGERMTDAWKDKCRSELEVVIVDLFFLTLFPVPSSGKWTKTGPCTERFVCGCLGNIQPEVIKRALGKLTFDAGDAEMDLDDTFVAWSKVASKSSKITLKFLGDWNEKAAVVILLIVDEVYRYLTLVYMKFSSAEAPFQADKPSPIQILASDARSPVYTALCHLSSLLAGTSSRLRLIWHFRGCANASEWSEQFPQDVNMFVRACSVASANIERRQRSEFQKLGMQLLCMGDPDMPMKHIQTIADRAALSKKFALAPGFEERFWQRHQEKVPQDMDIEIRNLQISDNIRADRGMLGSASWAVVPSVFPCESLHSYHRKFAKENDQVRTLASVAASSCAHQTCVRHVRAVQQQTDRLALAAPPMPMPEQLPLVDEWVPSYKKAMTVEQLHRSEWIKDHIVEDPSFICASIAGWVAWRAAFRLVSEEQLAVLTDKADATKTIAAGHRAQQAALALCDKVDEEKLQNPLVSCDADAHPTLLPLSELVAHGGAFLGMFSSTPSAALRSLSQTELSAPQKSQPMDVSVLGALIFAKRTTLPSSMQRLLQEASLCFSSSLAAASDTFARHAQQMPPKDAKSMPAGSTFAARQPQTFDYHASTARMADMKTRLQGNFTKLAASGGPARSVGARDVFLALQLLSRVDGEPVGGDGDCVAMFVHLADAKARHSNVAPVQSTTVYKQVRRDYVALESRGLSGESFNGLVLSPVRQPVVDSWCAPHYHPFGVLSHAPLDTYSVDRLTVEALIAIGVQ